MRIACIHIPQFALQAANRHNPQLCGNAVALTASAPGATVVAYSRQAHERGVRAGMTAAVVRQLDNITVVAESVTAEREMVAALAESLFAVSAVVDRGGQFTGLHYALYAEVPAGMRGTTFGAKARDIAEQLGISVRIGIADDKFTAWVAASQMRALTRTTVANRNEEIAVTSVPRGGSAAFLASMPLSMLPISSEVQHMLTTLGVTTLGAFASLPEPSGGMRTDGRTVDLQALARGEGRDQLIAVRQRAVITESIAVTAQVSVGTAVGVLAGRMARVLLGRGEYAANLKLIVKGKTDRSSEIALFPSVVDAAALADRFGACIGDTAGVHEIIVEIVGRPHMDRTSEVNAEGMQTGVVKDLSTANEVEPAELESDDQDDLLPLSALSLASAPYHVMGRERAPHRRMKRGKQRRRADVTAQSRLFG
jgi:nucleotidyltransferase/DNA polymerase involved in DNA repair